MTNDGYLATSLRYLAFYFAARAAFEAFDGRWYHAGIKAAVALACIVPVALLTRGEDENTPSSS